MVSLAKGKTFMVFMVVILTTLPVGVSCIGRNEDAFGTISDKLGRPMNEEEFVHYVDSLFLPGLDYAEVHQIIDEIGENRICTGIVHLDGVKVEIVEIRTGRPALDEYDYLKWDFVFDAEGKLMRVGLNSWW